MDFAGLGTSAKGTVAASLFYDSGSVFWAGVNYPAPPGGGAYVLLTAEADGRPGWARPLPPRGYGNYNLAVDPAGQVAPISILNPDPSERCNAMRVLKYNLAGEFLWSRDFTPTDCATGTILPRGLAISGHNVFVVGFMDGRADFGFGTISRMNSSFILNLAP